MTGPAAAGPAGTGADGGRERFLADAAARGLDVEIVERTEPQLKCVTLMTQSSRLRKNWASICLVQSQVP